MAKKLVTFTKGLREAILSGDKRITVRAGEVNWADDLRLKVDGQEIAARKTGQEIACLHDLSAEAVLADGFADHGELLGGLRKFYPDLQENDTVTALWFEVVAEEPEAAGETEPVVAASPVEIMDSILGAKNRAIVAITEIRRMVADLDHEVQADERFEARWSAIFDATSAVNEEAKNIGGKFGKLTELVAAVNGEIESVRRAEERAQQALREVVCCACGQLTTAGIVVGEKGDPTRALEGVCPGCGMAGLQWADAPAPEPPAEETPPPEDDSPEESAPPAKDDGLVAVKCASNECDWDGRMAEDAIFDGKCPKCGTFVAYTEEA